MTTNYNIDPYYDDFDATKNYVRILFKPGVAVQARELTQIQSAIQEQIKSIGGFLFKNESLVSGGESFSQSVKWIDVTSANLPDSDVFLGKNITNDAGAKAIVVYTTNLVTPSTSRLFITYTGGILFNMGDEIREDATIPSTPEDVVTTGSVGESILYSIEQSVFYINGYFAVMPKQSIIVGDGSIQASAKIGATVTESVTTYQDDASLLDNAIGAPNYSAPGADRLTISLDLVSMAYEVETENLAENMVENTTDNFIELARYKYGNIVKKINGETLGNIEKILARRTFDESGDYTVTPFKAKVVESVRKNSDEFSLAVSPGKAYVKGYEFETERTIYVNLPKARTFTSINNRAATADFGDYFIVNSPTGGNIDFTNNIKVDIRKTAGNTIIGSAVIYAVQKHAAGKYKVFVFGTSMTAGSLSESTSLTAGAWTATIDGTNQEKLYTARRPSLVVPSGFSPVKNFFDVSYISQVKVSATAASNQLVITNAVDSSKQFYSTDPDDYVIVNTTSNTIVTTATTVVPSDQSFTINGVFTPGNIHDIFAKVSISSGSVKEKVKTSAKIYVQNSQTASISLGVSDIYKVNSITAVDAAGSEVPINLTNRYNVDNGQRDNQYTYGSLSLKTGQSHAPNTTHPILVVDFEYFVSAQSSGYFAINSYNTSTSNAALQVKYEDIPSFRTSDGKLHSLRDVLDFRPVRAALSLSSTLGAPFNPATAQSDTVAGNLKVMADGTITYDLEYYLSRIDKFIVTKEKKFDLIQGTPDVNPSVPSDIPDGMTLYVVNVPAWTFSADSVNLQYIDNRRYTMKDIGKIDKRVERLEYYTSMTLLEKQAADELDVDSTGLEKFKSGILVDPFVGFGVANLSSGEYSAAIDTVNKILRPKSTSYKFEYAIDSANGLNVGVKSGKDIVTLPYTKSAMIINTEATSWVNLQPYMVFNWAGQMEINPPSDTWTDVTKGADVVINVNGENNPFTVYSDVAAANSTSNVKWDAHRLINKGITVDDRSTTVDKTWLEKDANGNVIENSSQYTNVDKTTTTTENYLRNGLNVSKSEISTITQNFGAKVVDVSVAEYIRPRTLDFSVKKMMPNTRLFASFDGVDVTRFCTAYPYIKSKPAAGATKVRKINTSKEADVISVSDNIAYIRMVPAQSMFESSDEIEWNVNGIWIRGTETVQSVYTVSTSSIYTDTQGSVSGFFNIPNSAEVKFRTGEKVFRLADTLGKNPMTACETKYVASGLTQTTQNDFISTRVQTISIDPVSEVKSESTSDIVKISPTPIVITRDVTVQCGELQMGNGAQGYFEYDLDFGTSTGLSGINYDYTGVPDRYTIVWNGTSYSSGFVGSSEYDTDLTSRGLPGTVKFTTDAYPTEMGSIYDLSSRGKLRFNKTEFFPTTAKLIVEAPLPGTLWSYKMVCPGSTNDMIPEGNLRLDISIDTPNSVQLVWGDYLTETNSIISVDQTLWFGKLDPASNSLGTHGLYSAESPLLNYRANVAIRSTNDVPFGTAVILESLDIQESNRQRVISTTVTSTGSYRSIQYNDAYGFGAVDTSSTVTEWSGDFFNRKSVLVSRNGGEFTTASFPMEVYVGDTLVFDCAIGDKSKIFIGGSGSTNWNTGLTSRVVTSPYTPQDGHFVDYEYKLTAKLKSPIDGDYARMTVADTTDVSITRQNVVRVMQPRWQDPVAQTFLIDSSVNPSGVFIDSVDLYFRTKDTSEATTVTVQIRPTVNGYPSSKEVLPLASTVLYSSQINTSLDTDAIKLATNFKFDAPVYLLPDVEYAIVAIASSTKFEIFTSKLGDFYLSNPTSRNTSTPYLGSMFKSQNGSTWTAEQTEDILMRIQRCVFTAGTAQSLVLSVDTKASDVANTSFEYDYFYTDGEMLDFADTNVNYGIRASTKNSSGVYSVDAATSNYQLGSNMLVSRRALDLSNKNSLQFVCDISTSNAALTPVVDVNRLSGVLIQNLLNNNTNSEDTSVSYTINQVTGYTTTVEFRTTAAHSLVASDRVYVSLNGKPGLSGYFTILSVTSDTFTVGRQADIYASTFVATADSGSVSRYGQTLSKYVTNKVTLKPEFYSNDLSLMFNARLPNGANVVPMYKVAIPTDTSFDDEVWHPMELIYTGSAGASGFKEYKYKPTYTLVDETVALPTGALFSDFAIKLLFVSTSPSLIPEVKDLRVLALNS